MQKKVRLLLMLFLFFFNSFLGSQEQQKRGSDIIDIALVIDESGSMRINDPHSMRKDAALLLLDLLNVYDNVALVGFGEGARSINPFLGASPQKSALSQSIDSIKNADRYSMVKEGLQEILSVIKAREKTHPVAVILLSDGEFEEDDFPDGTDLSTYFYELNRLSQEFGENHFPVFAVAFTKAANIEILSSIARQSGGASYRAIQAKDIQKVYTDILQNISNLYTKKIGPVVLTGDAREFKIPVSSGVEQLIIAVFKESVSDPQPVITLFNPEGNITEGESNNRPSYSLVKVNNPVQGVWIARIKGKGKVEISFLEKIGVETKILKPRGKELSKALNDDLSVVVQLIPKDERVTLQDFGVEAEIIRPDHYTNSIEMNDEGMHIDEEAGDGIFSGNYNKLDKVGQYSLVIKTFPKNNEEIKRILKEDIAVKFVPDIELKIESLLNIDYPIRIFAKAGVTSKDVIIRSAEAEILLKGKFSTEIILRDNGDRKKSGDEKADDGIYSGLIKNIKDPGVYDIIARIFFEIAGGEIFSKQKRDNVYKLIETKDTSFKLERGKEQECAIYIKYFGTENANLNLIRTDIESKDNFIVKKYQDTFYLMAGEENLVKMSVTPSSDIKPGNYKGDLVFEVISPEISTVNNQFSVPINFHVLSWSEKNWLIIVVIVLIVGFIFAAIFLRCLTMPKFPRNARLVFLDESGVEISKYNLKRRQKFCQNKVIISDGIKISGIPKDSFKVTIHRDGKVTVTSLKKRIKFSEEDFLQLKKSRTIKPLDEFLVDGVKLRYVKE